MPRGRLSLNHICPSHLWTIDPNGWLPRPGTASTLVLWLPLVGEKRTVIPWKCWSMASRTVGSEAGPYCAFFGNVWTSVVSCRRVQACAVGMADGGSRLLQPSRGGGRVLECEREH